VVSLAADLYVLLPPAITLQPQSLVVTNGGSARIQAAATGTPPLSYQWFFQETNALAGATNDVLIFNEVASMDAGRYFVVVSNPAGSESSAAALLRVLTPPTIDVSGLNPGFTRFGIPLATLPGFNYELQFKEFLTDCSWTPLPPAVAGTGGVMVLWDDGLGSPSGARFYRVLCLPTSP
jgi:hypothetical protein